MAVFRRFKHILKALVLALFVLSSPALAYTITYNTNGGTMSGVTQVTENQQYTETQTGAYTLPNPTRDNYIFAGWCEDEGLTQNCDSVVTTSYTSKLTTKILSSNTDDKTYWAKWLKSAVEIATVDNIAKNTVVGFRLWTQGAFYVDWGDDSGIELINQTDTSGKLYSHTYTVAKPSGYTFRLASENIVAYDTSYEIPSIQFGYYSDVSGYDFVSTNNGRKDLSSIAYYSFIKKVEGRFSDLLPMLGDGSTDSQIPIFAYTFTNCTGLTTIGENLFAGYTKIRNYVFLGTFRNCTSLTKLPNNLFPNIPNINAWWGMTLMFYGDTNLSGYVPATLFKDIDTDPNVFGSNAMTNMFAGTALETSSCPVGTKQYITGFEDRIWIQDNTVANQPKSCIPINQIVCSAGEWAEADSETGLLKCTSCSGMTGCPTYAKLYDCEDENNASGEHYVSDTEANACVLVESYTITYHNGNTTTTATYTNDGVVTLPTLKEEGRKFLGWYANSDFTGEVITSFDMGYTGGDRDLYAKWMDFPFWVTTTKLAQDDYVAFRLAFKGTLYIDWGDESEIEVITTNNYYQTYPVVHRYTKADSKTNFTIMLKTENVTAYHSNTYPVIQFGFDSTSSTRFTSIANSATGNYSGYVYANVWRTRIKEVHGSLIDLFPILGDSSNQIPIFYRSFAYCTSLDTIGDNLFGGYSNTRDYMFQEAFINTALTKLPNNLFSNITTADDSYTFSKMFYNDTSLSGYIPATLFRNMTNKGSSFWYAMSDMFTGTGLDTSCPVDTKQYVTGFEQYWNGKVSCIPINQFMCAAGYTAVKSSENSSYHCESCSGNADCPTGVNLYNCQDEDYIGDEYYIGNDKSDACVLIGSYTITYHDGDTTTTETYTNDADVTLQIPSKDGYIFAGWYPNANFTGNGVMSLGMGYDGGDTDLYAKWIKSVFWVKTTSIAENDVVSFRLGVTGTIYVDWGDGSGVEVIECSVNNTGDERLYSHTYKTANQNGYTINFASENVTEYLSSGSDSSQTIKFGGLSGQDLIKEAHGSLSSLFPALGTSNYYIPSFYSLFNGCTNLDTLGDDLFGGYNNSDRIREYMFERAFNNTGLTALPNNLFSHINYASKEYMFENMFSNNSNLTGYIPATLFKNMYTSYLKATAMNNMFYNTNLDTSCPIGTKQYVTGFEQYWSGKVSCIPINQFMCSAGYKAVKNSNNSSYYCGSCSGDADCTSASGVNLYNCQDEDYIGDERYIGNTTSTSCVLVGPYTVTYHDGDTVTTATYQNDVAETLPIPTKEGYMAVGWYENSSFSGNRVSVLQPGITPNTNKHLYMKWVKPTFWVNTTSIAQDDYVAFKLNIEGKLYVDWGDGSDVEIINKQVIDEATYSHTYKIANPKGYKIRFASEDITYYYGNSYGNSTPTIQFGYSSTSSASHVSSNNGSLTVYSDVWRNRIKEAHGKLCDLFPYVSGSSTYSPNFVYSFGNCTNLDTIDENLFLGCFSLPYTYQGTFANTGLTTLPHNLFPNVTGVSNYGFRYLFNNNANLSGYIPATLFANIKTLSSYYPMTNIFGGTNNLMTSCPAEDNLKQYETGFESNWNGKVACMPLESILCKGGYEPNADYTDCVECPEGECPLYATIWCYSGARYDETTRTCPTTATDYTITYNTDGGVLSGTGITQDENDENLYTQTYRGLKNVLLPTPTKNDYMFLGWYDNPEFVGDKITSIPIGTVGDKYLYAKWKKVAVTITTVEITDEDITSNASSSASSRKGYVAFLLSAQGTFYVDWGDGSDVELITKKGSEIAYAYSHMYKAASGADGYTIRIASEDVVAYYSSYGRAAIQFGFSSTSNSSYTSQNEQVTVYSNVWRSKIKSVSGSFYELFPNLSDSTDYKYWPSFYQAFQHCDKLTSIGDNLFGGYNRPIYRMFYQTFAGTISNNVSTCGLESLPNNLFPQLDKAYEAQTFQYMFNNCTGITNEYIPASMFRNMTTENYNTSAMTSMFANTGTALQTACPVGTRQYKTGFEAQWNNKVSCIKNNEIVCPVGYKIVNDTCTSCCYEIDESKGCLTIDPDCPTYSLLQECQDSNYIADIALMKCIPIAPYTVTYYDGTTPTTITYPTNNEAVTDLPTPTKEGYAFGGWCVYEDDGTTNAGAECDVITTGFPVATSGNKVAYAKWYPFVFSVDIVEITQEDIDNNENYVAFDLGFKGTIYVDWGDGSRAETITKPNTNLYVYSHVYDTPGVYTIKFARGNINQYSSDMTIRFGFYSDSSNTRSSTNNNGLVVDTNVYRKKIKGTNGSMIDLFPVLTTGSSAYYNVPSFYQMFEYCDNLESIDENMFAGYSSVKDYMFRSAFAYCPKLTKLPHNLFPNIVNINNGMYAFGDMFYNDSNLSGYIPATLFANMDSANYVNSGWYAMSSIFNSSSTDTANKLATTTTGCPDGTKQYETGFESYWSNRIACMPTESILCKGGYKPNADYSACESCSGTGCSTIAKIWCYSGARYDERTGTCPASATYYTGTYNTDGGALSGDGIVQDENDTSLYTQKYSGAMDIVVPVPTKSGFEFTGWCVYNSAANTGVNCAENTRESEVIIPEGTANDIWLYATWTAEYTITYNTNGGSMSDVTQITENQQYTEIRTGEYTLPNPTKSGYVFGGWCPEPIDNNTGFCSVDTVSQIAPNSSDSTLYAIWFEIPNNSVSLKTENVVSGDEICMLLTPKGVFNIDWGDGSNTPIDHVSYNVNLSDVENLPEGYEYEFCHTYDDNAPTNPTITLSGQATRYFYDDYGDPVQTFMVTGTKVTSVAGHLGRVFPTLNNGATGYDNPNFLDAFSGLGSNFTTIENADLFDGITTLGEGMFSLTFAGTGLTEIPCDDDTGKCLFDGITGFARLAYDGTFANTPITYIPENLFSDVSGSAKGMFNGTFYGCTGLTELPDSLFPNITDTLASDVFLGMFEDCTNLGTGNKKYVPYTLFENMSTTNYSSSGAMDAIFYNTALKTTTDIANGDYQCPAGMLEYTSWTDTFQTGFDTGSGSPAVVCASLMLYTITYNTDGGVLASDDNIVQDENDTSLYTQEYYESESINVPAPTKSGYDFAGWCVYDTETNDGANCDNADRQLSVTIPEESSTVGDRWLYATWTPIEYTITYTANGGTLSGKDIVQDNENSDLYTQTYTVANIVVIPNPTKSGYIFGGWCPEPVNGNEVPCPVDTVSELEFDTGNKSFYATWFEDKFQIITNAVGYRAENARDDEFCFDIYAAGNFVIDWDDESNFEITRKSYASADHGDDTEVCHIYSGNPRTRTIRMGGLATRYDDGSMKDTHSISFYDNQYITQLTGSLGAIFPTIWDANHEHIEQQPNFTSTFESCTNLTTIPGELFSRTVGNEYQGISGNGEGLFYFTFAGSGITHIPSNLFAGVSGAADAMFSYTFSGCDGLGTDPNYPNPIPGNLFAGVSGSAEQLFNSTFQGCTGLTKLPNSLFPNITTAPAEEMFRETFAECTNLTGYVPYTLFKNMNTEDFEVSSMGGIFDRTALKTITDIANGDYQCPEGMVEYTGWADTFQTDFDTGSGSPAVVCRSLDSITITCPAGQYAHWFGGDDLRCAYCPEGSYCTGQNSTGGTVLNYQDNGKYECPSETPNSYAGSKVSQNCVYCPAAYKVADGTSSWRTEFDIGSSAEVSDMIGDGAIGEWLDFDGDGTKNINECFVVSSISGEESDEAEFNLCLENDENCDWNKVGVGTMICRYDEVTDKYSNCSGVAKLCSFASVGKIETIVDNAEQYTDIEYSESQKGSWYKPSFMFAWLDYDLGLRGLTRDTVNWNNFFVNDFDTITDASQVVESTTCCADGYYLDVSGATPTCTICPAGSYCGTADGYPLNAQENMGIHPCPEHSTALEPGATSCVCDEGYNMNTNTNTCVACPMGTFWNAENNICDPVVCPDASYSATDPDTGLRMSQNQLAKSYGSTINECVATRAYIEHPEALEGHALLSATQEQLLAAGLSIAFCKYNGTDAYDAGCTSRYLLCENDDLAEVIPLWQNGGPVSLMQYTLGLDDETNYGELFTENSAGLMSATAIDRCCPDGWVCCGAGTYIDFDAIGTADQCPICPAGSYCEGKQWNPETEFDSGEEKCLAGTYSSVEGATSADTCLPCPTDYPLSADGTTDIAQCYANCPTNPVCVDNASSCAYVNANQTTKTFGNVCGTNIDAQTGCNGGYTPTDAATWLSANQNKMIPLSVCRLISQSNCNETITFADSTQETITLKPGQFAVGLNDAPITNSRGYASCNETVGDNSSTVARISNKKFVPTVTGANCWVKLSQIGNMEIDTSWVYVTAYADKAECERWCGVLINSSNPYPYQQDVLVALMMTAAQKQINVCEANIVNIDWNGVDEPNNLGMCTYGKQLTVPDAPKEEGRLFLGWKLVSTTNNNNPEENTGE